MFSWILPRRSDPLKATLDIAIWRAVSGDPGSEATIALHKMSMKQPVRSQMFLFDVNTNHVEASMHAQTEEVSSANDSGKSERRIVPQQRADQARETKPGNAGAGKASEPNGTVAPK
jgi:hypothetical protein